MLEKTGKGILVVILTAGVLVGAYLGYMRYFIELQDRTVELCVDLNDLKTMAAYEKIPLEPILEEIRKKGVLSIGVLEETLPEANASGELYYSKGSGVLRFSQLSPKLYSLYERGLIKPNRTYIYAPFEEVRKRVYDQLKWALGEKRIRFLGREIMEIDEIEEEIRTVGLGISETQSRFLKKKDFRIIPRLWNDPHYHLGNMELKISALQEYDQIIFDGEEILGYPDVIAPLAAALKRQKIKFGYLEIIKQYGNHQLKKLMGKETVRVHSVSRDELKKITRDEAITRFVRAARERKVKLIYLRPFLLPQVEAYPVAYNLNYFARVKDALEKAGFVLGKALPIPSLEVKGWQALLLGSGIIVGALFLLNSFVKLPILIMYLLLLLSVGGMLFAGGAGYATQLQKGLALLAAVTFPSLAVISTFSAKKRVALLFWDSILIILNILGETLIGVFLLVGLLADCRFMAGAEAFAGVKIALISPILLVALYFVLKQGEGSFKERMLSFLNTDVRMIAVVIGLLFLGTLGIFIARSANFVLPVPGFEKYFRNILETVLFVRPRTKEFLVGYPFLFLAAIYFLRGKQKWFWLLAAAGTIAPVSVFNSFCHVHTPIIVSISRTLNGLILGIIIGAIAGLIANRYIRE